MKLYYREMGEGTPLMIIHGLMGSSDNWGTIGRNLAENYRVLLLDMRNHGRSPHSEEFGYDIMAADVHNLMNDLAIEKATLIGHSMGGKVAMSFARDFPERLARLVVVDMAPKSYPTSSFEQLMNALLSVDLQQLQSRQMADDQLKAAIPEEGVRFFLLKNLKRVNNENGGPAFEWKFNLPVLYKYLGEATAGLDFDTPFEGPTFFMRGENSDYLLDSDRPKIKRLFPAAEIATIPGAGHWVHAEAPTAFREALLKFLQQTAD